jgi:hypothetical protein
MPNEKNQVAGFIIAQLRIYRNIETDTKMSGDRGSNSVAEALTPCAWLITGKLYESAGALWCLSVSSTARSTGLLNWCGPFRHRGIFLRNTTNVPTCTVKINQS